MAALRPPSSIAAPISTASSSRWSRAAITTRDRFACRPNASSSMPTIDAEFLERFTTRVRALRVGDPLRPETEVGPLIHPREADRVASWIEEAVASGGQVLVGGERLSETTLSPTVLLDPPPEARISREEVFGPVTCVYRYTDLDEAIAVANALPVAFQASVFAQDHRRRTSRRGAARRLRRHDERPDGLPDRLDAFRWPAPIRLRRRRHPLHDARDDPGEDDRLASIARSAAWLSGGRLKG